MRFCLLVFLIALVTACQRDGGPAPTASSRRSLPATSVADGSSAANSASRPRAPRPPDLPAPSAGAPDLDALLAMLAQHHSWRFDAGAQDRGCPADQTLGEYLALLARYGGQGDAPGDVHRLAGACLDEIPEADRIAIDPPADPAYWICRIDAYTSDPAGESPWHYELRLRVSRSSRAVDVATLACPGTP